MSAPDHALHTRLVAIVAEMAANTTNNLAWFDAVLGRWDAAARARQWAEWVEKPPAVVMAYGTGAPPKAPFWLIYLAGESPDKTMAGQRVRAARVTLGTRVYEMRGGPWRQRVQVWIFANNPETLRAHYLLAHSCAYRAADEIVKLYRLAGASPVSGGDANIDPKMFPMDEAAAPNARVIEWSFLYEQYGFVPVGNDLHDVTVTPTPVDL